MTKAILQTLVACALLAASGCSVPYFASVRGPIRDIVVLDAESGKDIPEATVSLTSQTSRRYLGPPPCTLTCPDLFEIRAGLKSGGGLKRDDRMAFHALPGMGLGSWGFFTGRPEDPNEYPRGIILVDARGYRPAMLRFTVGKIAPGWSCVETAESEDDAGAAADLAARGNRCEFGDDRTLRFYLRPVVVSSQP